MLENDCLTLKELIDEIGCYYYSEGEEVDYKLYNLSQKGKSALANIMKELKLEDLVD